jgi:hypothetical protein
MGSRPYLTDFNGRNPGLFTQVFPYFLPKCYTDVVGQVCHDHLGGDADVLTCHCICELRVVGHRGAPCQPFSRILSRTVGGRGVRMAALPSTLARVLRRHPWTHGYVSPCTGVRFIRGLSTLRVDVQPVDLLPPVDHLLAVSAESPTSLASGRGSGRPCESKLPHSEPTGGAVLWLCSAFAMYCARLSRAASPGMC